MFKLPLKENKKEDKKNESIYYSKKDILSYDYKLPIYPTINGYSFTHIIVWCDIPLLLYKKQTQKVSSTIVFYYDANNVLYELFSESDDIIDIVSTGTSLYAKVYESSLDAYYIVQYILKGNTLESTGGMILEYQRYHDLAVSSNEMFIENRVYLVGFDCYEIVPKYSSNKCADEILGLKRVLEKPSKFDKDFFQSYTRIIYVKNFHLYIKKI